MLALAFGGLVALSVGAVLLLSVQANFVNTRALLEANAISMIEDLKQRIVAQSRQNEQALLTLAKLHRQGYVSSTDSAARRAVLEALTGTARDISGIALTFEEGDDIAYFRDRGFAAFPEELLSAASRQEPESGADPPQTGAALQSTGDLAPWQTPVSIEGDLYLSVATNLGDDGVAFALLRQDVVSRLIGEIAPPNGAVVFLLSRAGRVISHSGMPELFRRGEFPRISEFPDPALRAFPTAVRFEGSPEMKAEGVELRDTPGYSEGYVFVTTELTGQWSQPLTLGVYFRKVDVGSEILRVFYVLLAGIAALLLAVAAAIILGRRISRPLVDVAQSASQLSDMRFDKLKPLPSSRIREIDRQASALNNMYTTVLQFTRYVPRELVEQLMRSGEIANQPVERDVTVLFTDIVGFTHLSETMDANQTARLLNRHFQILGSRISATGGTVDKFMGDGVMAFWGAPADDPDHVDHALAAVVEIVRSVDADNTKIIERGEPPLQLRLGLHTGPVVVGNIGGEVRQNYTIVGDTVNVAQRLEQLGKEFMPDGSQCIVLVSSAIVEAAGEEFVFRRIGEHKIRGRDRSIDVCILDVAKT